MSKLDQPGMSPDFNSDNYLARLGLEAGANKNDIQQAFRRLMKANHPDLHPEERDKFVEISKSLGEAYDGLKNGVTQKPSGPNIAASGVGNPFDSPEFRAAAAAEMQMEQAWYDAVQSQYDAAYKELKPQVDLVQDELWKKYGIIISTVPRKGEKYENPNIQDVLRLLKDVVEKVENLHPDERALLRGSIITIETEEHTSPFKFSTNGRFYSVSNQVYMWANIPGFPFSDTPSFEIAQDAKRLKWASGFTAASGTSKIDAQMIRLSITGKREPEKVSPDPWIRLLSAFARDSGVAVAYARGERSRDIALQAVADLLYLKEQCIDLGVDLKSRNFKIEGKFDTEKKYYVYTLFIDGRKGYHPEDMVGTVLRIKDLIRNH
ncbi:MAG: hypothetical protein G01um10148_440 [Parcubacteria group bacterium Gr01-1014_8]|nr:MAG: hypothetical protein G01um10148_440 [Parcubacteria group bacterium Gr01-1014_8]